LTEMSHGPGWPVSKRMGGHFGGEWVVTLEEILQMYANEAIDYIRHEWESGKELGGNARELTDRNVWDRRYRKKMLEAAPSDYKEFGQFMRDAQKEERSLTKQQQHDAARIYAHYFFRLKKLKQNYFYRVVTFNTLNGITTRKSTMQRFLPDPDNGTAIMDSGLMSASLKGRFRPGKTYTARDGKTYHVQDNVTLTAAKNRQTAALKAGLSPRNSARVLRQMNGNHPAFRNTRALVDNAIYWRDMKQKMVKLAIVMRVAMRFAQIAGKVAF